MDARQLTSQNAGNPGRTDVTAVPPAQPARSGCQPVVVVPTPIAGVVEVGSPALLRIEPDMLFRR
jgi:hypothetical protein